MMYWWCLGDDKFILYEKTKFKKKYHLNVTKYKVYKKFIKSHWEVRASNDVSRIGSSKMIYLQCEN